MPVPSRLPDEAVRRGAAVLAVAAALVVAGGGAGAEAPTLLDSAAQQPAGVGFFVRSLANPRERREARADMLDAPVLPGSVIKAGTVITRNVPPQTFVGAPQAEAIGRVTVPLTSAGSYLEFVRGIRPIEPVEPLKAVES